jgi:hypothetical protein
VRTSAVHCALPFVLSFHFVTRRNRCPLHVPNDVRNTLAAWNSNQNWLYYEYKLVVSSVFLSFATSIPRISRSYLQISV